MISTVNNNPTLDNFRSNCICVRAYLRMYRPLHSHISLYRYELLICVRDLMCSQCLQVSDGIRLFPDLVTVYFCKTIVGPSFMFIVVSQPISPIALRKIECIWQKKFLRSPRMLLSLSTCEPVFCSFFSHFRILKMTTLTQLQWVYCLSAKILI